MNKKALAGFCMALAAIAVGYWLIAGEGSMFTKTQVEVKIKEDDGFGEMRERSEWKEAFVPGLLDAVLPVAGGLNAAAIVLLLLDRRGRKRVPAAA